MLKKLLFPFLLFFFCFTAEAQAPIEEERTAVVAVIQRMFDAMRAGDSMALRATFDTSARLQTAAANKEGKHILIAETVDEFAKAVGTPHKEVYDERIWSYDVRIDGRLASAWTEYSFFLGDKLSHCGVNAFQLFKGENGWKITQITDTRRRENCQAEPNTDLGAINQLMDAWHHAAAMADEDKFFGSMTPDGIYLGTDASERWLRDEMKEWSKKYFDRESAWAFTAHNRHVYFSSNGQTAWFEELLDTWMGPCRGSGVLQRTVDGWKIRHYNLAVAVANDVINDYIKLLPKK
ncbi:MAG: nuclear transport factor 2 family protein [Saprospiraceae bacterium]|nr:nuclear transport factor 2 family protein [Saprospiraceae bacterium]